MTDSAPPPSLRARSRRLGGPLPRLALALDTLEHDYQSSIVRGAALSAQERGATLVIFARGLQKETPVHHDPGIFRLLSPEQYQGLALMTGTLTSSEDQSLIDADFAGFRGARLVSLGIELADAHSVLINNHEGMSSAVEHLIIAHARRRIVFLRGPTSNREAEERFAAYRSILESNDIAFDERLVVQCAFRRGSGRKAICTLLDERGLSVDDIDAIVCADDLMALDALDELASRKIYVPGQIAVIGFDDIEEARFHNPPLSSLSQPLAEQGKEAVRLLLMGDAAQIKRRVLPTAQHFRRSCGCLFDDVTASLAPVTAAAAMDLEASLIRRRELVLAEITRAARAAFIGVPRGWEVRLFNALLDEFKGQAGAFRRAFDQLLELALAADDDASASHAVISALRKQLGPCAGNDAVALRRIESVLHEARALASAVVERAQAQKRIRLERWSQTLGEVSSRLVSELDLGEFSYTLQQELPKVGIHACLIAEFSSANGESAQVIAGFHGSETLPVNQPEFASVDLYPDSFSSIDTRLTLVVEPLIIDEQLRGYIVFEWQDLPGYVYSVLRQLLTAAVRSARLVEGLQERVSHLPA